ncbi:c-type cytochrome [Eudoraea chungangensis]|uniref:c-type cytochrome n=1 Tax=Eudoraea chungangensis TaxID=1481905 RepID=UPI0023ECCA75|nr:c-type cytochrome [Eudoraea chungangensis]
MHFTSKIQFALLTTLSLFLVISCSPKKVAEMTGDGNEVKFNIPKDFTLTEIYHQSEEKQGSWVALAEDDKGIIYACDQRGKIYFFKRPEKDGTVNSKQVDSLNLNIGEAHGLLWAFNSLYVAVNKNWEDASGDKTIRGSGIYRITDSTGDGALNDVQMLLKLEGAGEHGPHSFVLSPDGSEIYFIAGNHVLIPEALKKNSKLPTNWGEDNLFPPYLDARGHANDIKAPGGWIAKFDQTGENWELISAGYRNPFDFAFNSDGELFAYDADMEWDIGMPWYRPTRLCHVTPGSEYGWRTGSGKWPAYYPDNLPAVHNLEQGSPTAVVSAAKLRFPSKYTSGIFIMDWSFGTIYHINLEPAGSSYTGVREEFLSGTPLPLTDMIVGKDGNLYFATGGRGLDSRLYRLSYDGDVNLSDKRDVNSEAEDLRALRHRIENYSKMKEEEAIALAWENLNHPDRFIRYASRISLEKMPLDLWKEAFIHEPNDIKTIEAGIAMARQGQTDNKDLILNKLNAINWNDLSETQQVDLLRNYALVFIRMGNPNSSQRRSVLNKLKGRFPSQNDIINRELAALLLYLNEKNAVLNSVALLEKHTIEKTQIDSGMLSEEATLRSEQYGPLIREVIAKMPPGEAIYYGVLLSHAKEGWSKELREKYFMWFYDVLSAKGGMSFKAYMENVRLQAMRNVPENEKAYFEELSGVYSPNTIVEELPQPIGPGANYSGSTVSSFVWGDKMTNYNGTIEAGERAYKAALCILCHRMNGEGGATGPDLTQIRSKFGKYDLLFAIYSPNDAISDQYAFTLFHLDTKKKIAGRILSETSDSIKIMPNPLNTTYSVQLAKSSIIKRELSPISPMPSGLLNRLNEQEIADLFAYLLAAGDETDEVYNSNINP